MSKVICDKCGRKTTLNPTDAYEIGWSIPPFNNETVCTVCNRLAQK